MAETETNQTEARERTPEEIEAEIERTREELADTASAVAEKTDVKAQAQKKVDETKAQARENPVPIAAVAGGLLALLILIRLVRR